MKINQRTQETYFYSDRPGAVFPVKRRQRLLFWWAMGLSLLLTLVSIQGIRASGPIIRFTANAVGSVGVVYWETSNEVGIDSFYVQRSSSVTPTYQRVPIGNPWRFEAFGGEEGYVYEFADQQTVRGVTYYYKLEIVTSGSGTQFYGPITLTIPLGASTPTFTPTPTPGPSATPNALTATPTPTPTLTVTPTPGGPTLTATPTRSGTSVSGTGTPTSTPGTAMPRPTTGAGTSPLNTPTLTVTVTLQPSPTPTILPPTFTPTPQPSPTPTLAEPTEASPFPTPEMPLPPADFTPPPTVYSTPTVPVGGIPLQHSEPPASPPVWPWILFGFGLGGIFTSGIWWVWWQQQKNR